ncbi:hypothetical protein [Paenibacillus crassostreae]|uniref:Apea-like HEPN domain-containing protein n=1 Tax=Paenibacillus crassostreae TaxID=1763538 RepID=A0A167FKF5_9BACL|nr:hypothetical protein [Paenibacillus crassostreae]AOZ94311.1 hypothetical protein LPB68_20310 [Paenibacillus crassostreae]OAB76651.1 hypothetical protein PNBC_04430 [Paenibacillus crassostreae]
MTYRLLDSDHSRDVFAYFGLAVYSSQALEQQLVNLLMLMKLSEGKIPSEEDFTELYQRKLSSSLGQLVQEIQHHFPFSEEETIQLKKLWKQRNYIVHDYFKERIQETFSPGGRSRMIRELKSFTEQSQKLEKKLQGYSKELYRTLGLDTDSGGKV